MGIKEREKERGILGVGGQSEGKRPLGRSRRRWGIVKMGIREIGNEGTDWNNLARDREKFRALENRITNTNAPWEAGNFLIRWKTICTLRRAMQHKRTKLADVAVKQYCTEPQNTLLQPLSYFNRTDCILKFCRAIGWLAGKFPSPESNFAQTVQQTNHLARAVTCGLRLLVIYSLRITVRWQIPSLWRVCTTHFNIYRTPVGNTRRIK